MVYCNTNTHTSISKGFISSGWNVSASIVKSCEIDRKLFPAQQYVTMGNVTYLNYACAICNNRSVQSSDVVFWSVKMTCSRIPLHYTAQIRENRSLSYEELLGYTLGEGLFGKFTKIMTSRSYKDKPLLCDVVLVWNMTSQF